jgi:hypothetical protein
VHVNQPARRDGLGDAGAEQVKGASVIERVDAMHYTRGRLGKPLGERFGEEQMLGRAGATTLAQHPRDRPISGATIRQGSHSFDKLDKRCVSDGQPTAPARSA